MALSRTRQLDPEADGHEIKPYQHLVQTHHFQKARLCSVVCVIDVDETRVEEHMLYVVNERDI